MKTYIIGKRSYLSLKLKKKINNSNIISEKEISSIKGIKKFNLIINTFYPSKYLNSIQNYENFYEKSIMSLAKILDKVPQKKINKIIYSSSSSIYNSIKENDFSDKLNRNIYSSTKLACENLIKNFCSKNKIFFHITRIFNMYGENDDFSIISKIIKSYKKNKIIYLNNEGNSVRDFINVNTVSKIYLKLLNLKKSGIIDIGSGYGTNISDIIDKLGKKNFKIKKINFKEQTLSIAQKDVTENTNSKNLEFFLKEKLKLRKSINFEKIYINKKNLINDFIQGTIVYGAGNAGKQIYSNLIESSSNSVHCFVDDNKKKQKKKIFKKNILSYKDLIELSRNKIISNIIVAIPSLAKDKLNSLLKKLNQIALNVSFIPLKNDLFKNKITLSDVTDSEMVDLFDRKITKTKFSLLKKIKNKSILVTGAAGSIGSEIIQQLISLKAKKIISLDNSELQLYELQKELKFRNVSKFILGDIMNKSLIYKICKKYKINTVFHAAAYKHVNILENNISSAVENNIFGTMNLLDVTSKLKINTIIISTDKATKPKSILGMTKRISEIIALNYEKINKTNINVVRFGNVFGSKGSAINLFIEQINSKKPITLTDKKAKRYFMSVKEACNLVLQGSQLSLSGKILILNMGKQLHLVEIIKKLISLKNDNNSYEYKIKEIGLKKGEKLKESLSINDKLKSTIHKDIYVAKEPTYFNSEVMNLINNLRVNLEKNSDDRLKRIMTNFLKKEIYKS